MNEPILEVIGLSKHFGGIIATDDVSLTLEPGDVKYLRFRVEFNTDKMSIGTFRGQYIINLHAIAESEAIYQIRETKPAGG